MFCFFGLVTEAPTFEAKSSEEIDIHAGVKCNQSTLPWHYGFLEVASARLDPVTLALAMS